jgi:hypothetical protein
MNFQQYEQLRMKLDYIHMRISDLSGKQVDIGTWGEFDTSVSIHVNTLSSKHHEHYVLPIKTAVELCEKADDYTTLRTQLQELNLKV